MASHAATRFAPARPVGRYGRSVRVRARLTRARLDRRIAAGEHALGAPDLELRSAQLRSARTRNSVARGLERAIAEIDTPPAVGAALPVHREAVREARPALEQLIAALRSAEPGEAQGVALATRLLTNAAGPLYAPSDLDALYCSAREALLALTRRKHRGAPAAP